MKENFIINMNKEEMLRFYANKIVEDGIQSCTEYSNLIGLTDYNNGDFKLEKYKTEILQLLYRDERVSDVTIDDEMNVDLVFYTDFCPFYYDEEESITYNDITDNPTYQAIMLSEFVDYMQKRIFEETYISSRELINNFTNQKQINEENKSKLSNFLKKSIIQTGFVDKYIDNVNVYVTNNNYKELETALIKIIKTLDQKSKVNMETEELE